MAPSQGTVARCYICDGARQGMISPEKTANRLGVRGFGSMLICQQCCRTYSVLQKELVAALAPILEHIEDWSGAFTRR